jgi:hypothetical protein
VADQARDAPAIAVRLASTLPNGARLASDARDAFAVGMRDSVLFGMGLLLVGAVYVWVRGASRTEEVLEDELDAEMERVA